MKRLDLRQHFRDKILHCCDCGQSFVFSAGEQAYFQSKGLSERNDAGHAVSCGKGRLFRRCIMTRPRDFNDILSRLPGAKQSGDQWTAPCPLPVTKRRRTRYLKGRRRQGSSYLPGREAYLLGLLRRMGL